MYIFHLYLLLVILFISNTSLISSKRLTNSSICSTINITEITKYTNLFELENAVNNILAANPYPMNNRVILNSSIRNPNPCPFRERVLGKMSRNETINVVVVGGSNSFGIGLIDFSVFPVSHENRLKYRWSQILENYLNSGWYSGHFNVDNIAQSGWSVETWNTRLDLINIAKPDILITDFSMNDIDVIRGRKLDDPYFIYLLLLESINSKPALLFDFTFKFMHPVDGKCIPDVKKREFFVKIKSDDGFLCSFYEHWKVSDYGRVIPEKYEVPYTSYRDVVYPDFFNPPSNIQQFWSGDHHPNATTHKLLADHMFNTLAFLIKDSLFTNKCLKQERIYHPFDYCNRSGYIEPKYFDPSIRPVCYPNEIITLMDATREYESKNSFLMGNDFVEEESHWKFYADSKSKFGWIYDQKYKSNLLNYITLSSSNANFKRNVTYNMLPKEEILSFKITLNTVAQLTFLSSYPGYYGGILIWFDKNIFNNYYVSTRWTKPTSVPSITNLFIKNSMINKKLTINSKDFLNILPGSHVINIFPIPSQVYSLARVKVKVLGAITC